MAQLIRDVAWRATAAAAALLMSIAATLPVRADTLKGALISAYRNNPQINSQRAVVRATDESVPQALSGYRPTVAVTVQPGWGYTSTLSKVVDATGVPSYPRTSFV